MKVLASLRNTSEDQSDLLTNLTDLIMNAFEVERGEPDQSPTKNSRAHKGKFHHFKRKINCLKEWITKFAE
jgi:hypothetical protein